MKLITFFYNLEKRIWDDRINSNRYFATISIYISTLVAAITTGAQIINSTFDTQIECTWYSAIAILAFIMIFNVIESILAVEKVWVGILRSLLVITFLLLGALVGAITSIVIAIILAIVAGILCLYFILVAISSGGRSRAELRSNDMIDTILGTGRTSGTISSDGLTFYGDDGKTYERDSTSSDNWRVR